MIMMLQTNLSRRVVYVIVCVSVLFYVSTTVYNIIFFKAFKQREINYDSKAVMDMLNEIQAKDDNPQLIGLIKNYYIEHPSNFPYNLNNPQTKDPSQGQAGVIDKLMNQKVIGFILNINSFVNILVWLF